MNTFIEEFGEFINRNTSTHFDLEDLNAEQISDIFEEVLVSVSKTSANHKKEAFNQILFKQLTTTSIDTDETLRFINITNELTPLQFKILSAFDDISDTMLKNKVQLIELEAESIELQKQITDLEGEYSVNPERIDPLKARLDTLPKLIERKRVALKSGKINPNYHTTFDIDRNTYITEVQDLIAKGLLFDFVLRTQLIDPFVHFGVTNLGRSYMEYVISK